MPLPTLGRCGPYFFVFALIAYAIYWVLTPGEIISPPRHNNPTVRASAATSIHAQPKQIKPQEPDARFPAAPRRPVMVANGKLSLNVKDTPLHSLLAEIEKQSHIEIKLADEIRFILISVDMADQSLVEGLSKILQNFDVITLYHPTVESTPSPKLIHVYGKGKGLALMPPVSAADMATKFAAGHAVTSGGGPATEGEASLPATGAAGSMSTVTQGLQSPDPKMRQRVLAQSLAWQVSPPAQLLEQMARSDTDHQIRNLALAALTQNPEADTSIVRATLEAAQGDIAPEVREQAKNLLAQMTVAATPNDAVPSAPSN